MIRLTGPQRRELREILLDAFDRDGLTRALAEATPSWEFEDLARPGAFAHQVFEVIGRAQRKGWLPQLVGLLRAEREGRPDLIEKAERILAGAPCETLETEPELALIAVRAIADFRADRQLIHQALDLFEDRIPADERYPRVQMLELIARHLTGEFGSTWKFHFLTASYRHRCVGMLLCYEDVAAGYCFVSYLAAQEPRGATKHSVTEELVSGLMRRRKELGLGGVRVVLEADDPELGADARERRKRLSRIRLFECTAPIWGARFRVVNVRYLQPKLDWRGNDGERELLLCYAAPGIDLALPRSEAAAILDWTYTQLYGDDIYSDPVTRAAYGKYIEGLRDQAVAALADPVSLLRSHELGSRIRARQ